MIIGLIIFFTFVGCFEYWKRRKWQAREEAAVYLDIKGKITESEIINKPYFASGGGRSSSIKVKSYYMRIFTIENDEGEKYKVKVADSSKYEGVNDDPYWNEDRWIDTEIKWKVKKYPEADILVFEESIHQVSRKEKSFWEIIRDRRKSS